MRLSLDHQQRLNLIALMGVRRGTVAEMRQFLRLMELLDLNDEEKKAIEWRTATAQDGSEQATWNPEKSLPVKEFEVNETDVARMRRVVEEWPHFLVAVDRKWILPLLDQMPEAPAAPAQPAMTM